MTRPSMTRPSMTRPTGSCARYDRMIEAYVDGECPADEAAALRVHVRDCAPCRRRAESLSRLQELVHDSLAAEPAPPGLWQKIDEGLDAVEAAPRADRFPRLAPWGGWRRLAAVAAVLVLLVAGALALRPGVSSEQLVVHETVEDFVTFQLSGRPFDSVATDPVAVRAWFADKIQFALPRLMSEVAGYQLVGSRLCWLLDRRLGAFTYRRDDRLMTLYVMDGEGIELADGRFDEALGAMAARRRVEAYNSLVWRHGDLLFSLVSTAPDDEMTAFAAAVLDGARQHVERAGAAVPQKAT